MTSKHPVANSFQAETFRKKLHQQPELSGNEAKTATAIADQLRAFGLTPTVAVGGHGLFCVIEGKSAGQTTLLRADFDAVAVSEQALHQHASKHQGIMHACGHDGHTASLLAVAERLTKMKPQRGKVILLFQGAEETGVGARAMLNSPELKAIQLDNVFAFHNLPGQPLHEIVVKAGTFACASTGIVIKLQGKSSHAAYPEKGLNPVTVLQKILHFLQELPNQYPNQLSLVTIVNVQLGEPAFGVSAGEGKIMATLRSDDNNTFAQMKNQIEQKLAQLNNDSEIAISHAWHEPFNAASNSNTHVEMISKQARTLGLSVTELSEPMRWSEDFAEFLLQAPGALFGIGSGIHHAELHTPDYDFPDEIITTACTLLTAIINELHG